MNLVIKKKPTPAHIKKSIYIPISQLERISLLARENDVSFNHVVVCMIGACLAEDETAGADGSDETGSV